MSGKTTTEEREDEMTTAQILVALAAMMRERGAISVTDLGPITPDELRPYMRPNQDAAA